MELKYYRVLNGLRGTAALMVIIFHFLPDGPAGSVISYFRKAAIFGQTGVTLFFVLSGFLITRILMQQKAQKSYFSAFYIKRALRIFPLYYLGLILYFFVAPFISHSNGYGTGSWMYWAYLQNFANTFNWACAGPQHYWSLAVEEHFYLFWPLIVYYVPVKFLPRAIGAIIAIALICRCILLCFGYGTFYFTFSVMDALAIGGLLACYEAGLIKTRINFSILIPATLLLMLPAWLFTGGKGLAWVQIIKFPVIALFYMCVMGKLITSRTVLNALFDNAFLNYTGKISYGLYVYHPLCFGMIYYYYGPQNIWLKAAGGLVFSFMVATVSFYGFERPFLRLKQRLQS